MVMSIEKIYDAIMEALHDGDDVQDIHDAIRDAIADFNNEVNEDDEDEENDC